jgi:hypothetical protein
LSNFILVYLSVSCAQFYPCLSFCVLCPMLHVSIFLRLVSNVTRVFLSAFCTLDTRHRKIDTLTLDTRHRKIDTGNIRHNTQKIDTGNIGHKAQKDRHVQHWACVLCPMLPVSIFLCIVFNVTRVYLSVSCVQCDTCLSFCVLCPM